MPGPPLRLCGRERYFIVVTFENTCPSNRECGMPHPTFGLRGTGPAHLLEVDLCGAGRTRVQDRSRCHKAPSRERLRRRTRGDAQKPDTPVRGRQEAIRGAGPLRPEELFLRTIGWPLKTHNFVQFTHKFLTFRIVKYWWLWLTVSYGQCAKSRFRTGQISPSPRPEQGHDDD